MIRLSGLRSLCFSMPSINAAAMFDPLHCMMNGMFWSVALLSASSASLGCDLLSNGTSSNLRPSAPPLELMKSMMKFICLRLASPTCANGPDSGSV